MQTFRVDLEPKSVDGDVLLLEARVPSGGEVILPDHLQDGYNAKGTLAVEGMPKVPAMKAWVVSERRLKTERVITFRVEGGGWPEMHTEHGEDFKPWVWLRGERAEDEGE